MRNALSWDFTHRGMVVSYRRIGTRVTSRVKQASTLRKIQKRAQVCFTPRGKHEITQWRACFLVEGQIDLLLIWFLDHWSLILHKCPIYCDSVWQEYLVLYPSTSYTQWNSFCYYVEIKCQLDATEVFIADLIACSTCFGHHYAHHQELKSIIQWLLPVAFRAAASCKPDT